MGFQVKAEYALKLLRAPRRFSHVSQRFLLTGFVLSSSHDEHALSAITGRWREIDAVTSNRIRFLFFLERETVLTGWPHRPSFTDYGYRKYNRHLIADLTEAGFSVSTTLGFQTPDFSTSAWRPERKVRRVAQQLGIAGRMPCLVWMRDDKPSEMYVCALHDMAPSAIYELIKRTSDQFYDDNVAILNEIDEREAWIDRSCGSLKLTLHGLDNLSRAAQADVALVELLGWLTSLAPTDEPSVDCRCLSTAVDHLSARRELLGAHLPAMLTPLKRWADGIQAFIAALRGRSPFSVPFAAGLMVQGQRLALILGPTFSPESRLLAFPHFGRLFETYQNLGAKLTGLNGIAPALASRFQRSLDHVNALLAGTQSPPTVDSCYVTLINAYKILNEFSQMDICQGTESIAKAFLAAIISNTAAISSAVLASLGDRVRFELADTSGAFNAAAQVGISEASRTRASLPRLLAEARVRVEDIDRIVQRLNWDTLSGFLKETVPPSGELPLPISPPDTVKPLELLADELGGRMVPIEDAVARMHAGDMLASFRVPPPTLSREAILDLLSGLLPAQFTALVYLVGVHPSQMSPDTVPQTQRAIELIRMAEGQFGMDALARAIQRVTSLVRSLRVA